MNMMLLQTLVSNPTEVNGLTLNLARLYLQHAKFQKLFLLYCMFYIFLSLDLVEAH